MFQPHTPDSFQGTPLPLADRRSVWTALMPRRSRALVRLSIAAAPALADVVAILALGLAIDLVYHNGLEGLAHPISEHLNLGVAVVVAAVVFLTNLLRDEYRLDRALSGAPSLRHMMTVWLLAWVGVLVVGFATKTTDSFSRAVAAMFFVSGLPVMFATRVAVSGLVRRMASVNASSASRIHLVGYEEDIAQFHARNEAGTLGLRVVGTSFLRRPDPAADAQTQAASLCEDLDLAVSVVRFLRPDDVFLLMPWANIGDLERCIEAFMRVPAALHLRPGAILDRYPKLEVARIGHLSGLNIGRQPLTLAEICLKRVFDIVASVTALFLLAPLFAVIALMIKLDSPGPVLFRQRRYGFNQQAFSVYKFRSMKVHDERTFRQATRGDDRITRVGRILRRANFDELPQLLNVLTGDMSLVGPRPHALAHDRSFEGRIALYARRHNVKPGITGWAQVNGLRGETLTDEAMERRIAADLHYIDNWSFWLDLQIILRTVISPKAYRNAY